ncbi:uncharacterized protein LOC125491455 [Plutella xylostella]|uniref:uncharacterized protein LOC125491455 n=1 Tax=Plutella xylostella TaxID=51655 RepID=UPI002032C40C|nr:uncharacterized protein LOC125491455 [Plutella xylostella]
MESITKSLEEMKEMFGSSMASFQEQLNSKSPGPPTTTGLAAEFSTFRAFIMSALGTLQQQVEFLARGMDAVEMRSRRKMLLVHGVPESKDEDTTVATIKELAGHFADPELCREVDVRHCHRLGRSVGEKPRPVVLKLKEASLRDRIWFSKTKLKGSGVTLSEFLTKPRHDTFMAARQRVGVSRCWTRDGCVFVLSPDGKRHRAVTVAELDAVCPPTLLAGSSSVASTLPGAAKKGSEKAPSTKARPKRATIQKSA